MKTFQVSSCCEQIHSVSDAQLLFDKISKIVITEDIILDFNNIKYSSHSFFLVLISKLINLLGKEKFLSSVKFENLSKMLQHNYEIAYNYYRATYRK